MLTEFCAYQLGLLSARSRSDAARRSISEQRAFLRACKNCLLASLIQDTEQITEKVTEKKLKVKAMHAENIRVTAKSPIADGHVA